MDKYLAYIEFLKIVNFSMIFLILMTVAMIIFAFIIKKKTDKIVAEKEKEYQKWLGNNF